VLHLLKVEKLVNITYINETFERLAEWYGVDYFREECNNVTGGKWLESRVLFSHITR